ncbi:MAG: hypothetical protein GEV09_10345 [Pseudonocardiaceae bacterium]|nr:hypothetical protein [Pseudonocardiaceae bacterium]
MEAAARGLQTVGVDWDAARLAGQAALRTPDRRAMVGLLGCARSLRNTTDATVAAAATPPAPRPSAAQDGAITGREREVAGLVLAGLTYRQLGERLFISAKTVEHHVARMRQRFGSTSRGELFAQLRTLIGDPRVPERE